MIDKDWFSPHAVTRFTKAMVRWLIPLLPMLRRGEYPPDPRAADSGYVEGGGKPQYRAGAKFETPAGIAGEIDWRIQRAGLDGLLMELLYCNDTEDEVFIIEHIAQSLNQSSQEVSKRIRNALYYVSGADRKTTSYSQYIRQGHRYLNQ